MLDFLGTLPQISPCNVPLLEELLEAIKAWKTLHRTLRKWQVLLVMGGHIRWYCLIQNKRQFCFKAESTYILSSLLIVVSLYIFQVYYLLVHTKHKMNTTCHAVLHFFSGFLGKSAHSHCLIVSVYLFACLFILPPDPSAQQLLKNNRNCQVNLTDVISKILTAQRFCSKRSPDSGEKYH